MDDSIVTSKKMRDIHFLLCSKGCGRICERDTIIKKATCGDCKLKNRREKTYGRGN